MSALSKDLIVPPLLLQNPVYLAGLHQPLEAVADILDEQGQHEHAMCIRYAVQIVSIYHRVLINGTHAIHLATPNTP